MIFKADKGQDDQVTYDEFLLVYRSKVWRHVRLAGATQLHLKAWNNEQDGMYKKLQVRPDTRVRSDLFTILFDHILHVSRLKRD